MNLRPAGLAGRLSPLKAGWQAESLPHPLEAEFQCELDHAQAL
jgi:hypothetical protein